MLHCTLAEALRGTEVSALQQRMLFQTVLRRELPEPEIVLDDDARLICWIYTLLARLPFLSFEQRLLILQEIQAAGDHILAGQLAFADTRYVTWEGYEGWLDLQTGKQGGIPHPPLETIAYNLRVYFVQRTRALSKPGTPDAQPGPGFASGLDRP